MKRKNVIWIFGDQHRAQALGCNNDPNVHTPNIDNLAASGVSFSNAISGYPLCCPARGSILTSRYPHKCVPGHEHRLPQDQPTIASVFNDAGYDTAYFGKWHIDGFKEEEGRKTGDCPVPFNHVDIAPTSLGLCGIEKPDWMEGTDFSSYRLENSPVDTEPDSAFLQSVIPTGHGDSVDKPWRGIVTDDGWKYVCFEGVPWLMFNLNEDPFELVNLAHNTLFFEKRKQLNERLIKWIEDTGDAFLLPSYK